MKDIVLDPSQEAACDKLLNALAEGKRTLVLTGPAGSGKTSLVRVLVERVKPLGWHTQYAASTGKAAVRLAQVTGFAATTIHAVLFRGVRETEDGDPVFLDPQPPCPNRTLFIIDEASMVDDSLDLEIRSQLPRDSAILYVGDREQLPPVVGTWGPDFENPTAVLTEIHRQALDNPILSISAALRTGGKLPKESQGTAYTRESTSLTGVAQWVVEQREKGQDLVVLCWTNDARQRLNRLVRRQLGFDTQGPLTLGDQVLVLYNNRHLGRMNGEVATIDAVKPFAETKWMEDCARYGSGATEKELKSLYVRLDGKTWALVQPDLLGVPYPEFRAFTHKGGIRLTEANSWLHMDHGFAITVHKSQGSEWKNVALIIDRTTRHLAGKDIGQTRRLIYTAVTRAKERLFVFDV